MVKFIALIGLLATSSVIHADEVSSTSNFIKVVAGPSALGSGLVKLNDEDRQLEETYRQAIAAVVRESLRNRPWPLRKPCRVDLTLLPGGEVIRADLADCKLSEQAQKEMTDLLAAHPVPYYGFQRIFGRKAAVLLEPR